MRSAVALVLLSLVTATCGAGAEPAPATIGLGERRSDGGAVEVVATWIAADPPALKVTMDTHSVDLDRSDLAALTRVRLDGGEWTVPSAVAVPTGGHHREGRIEFSGLAAGFGAARVIELEVRDVAVPLRILRWERGS